KAAKASGERPSATKPCPTSSFPTSGSCSAATMPSCQVLMISGGVPAGASAPYQLSLEETSAAASLSSGPDASSSVGTSGAIGERVGPLTASATSLPAFDCCRNVATVPKVSCTSPPSTAASIGPLTLWVTLTILMPVACMNSAMLRKP